MRKSLIGLLVVAAAIYFWNASWLVPAPTQPQLKLIAHRGVHQTFDRAGVDGTTCTATRIHPPSHGFIENTLASMQAAFEAGADVVELDVHPTTDGQFAVFHDWSLECRTDGTGVTRERDMAYLKTLDIGYGYTADGGATYPLRGKGVGLMPTLEEVLRAFPGKKFLLNYKSRDAREADMLATLLAEHPEWRDQIWAVYGGNEPTERAVALIKDLKGVSTRGAMQCLLRYLGVGWTGYVPEACRKTFVMVPGNFAWLMWGGRTGCTRACRVLGVPLSCSAPMPRAIPAHRASTRRSSLPWCQAALTDTSGPTRSKPLGPGPSASLTAWACEVTFLWPSA